MHEAIRSRFSRSEHIFGEYFISLSPAGQHVRTLIYTGFLEPHQDIENLLKKFAHAFDEASGKDKLFCIGAKAVSVLQGRYRRVNKIYPGPFSQMVTRFGTRSEHGTGVAGHPAKIQAAIDEVGLPRILLASAASAAEKLVYTAGVLKERKGIFYIIAGKSVEAIDGLVPEGGYHHHVLLSPCNPSETCARLEASTHIPNAIVDINYNGGSILGISPSSPYTPDEIYSILSDNPFGQAKRRTPIAIIGRAA